MLLGLVEIRLEEKEKEKNKERERERERERESESAFWAQKTGEQAGRRNGLQGNARWGGRLPVSWIN